MAIAAAHLVTSSSETDATSYETASIDPSDNNLVLAAVYSREVSSGIPNIPTLSGNGITWVAVTNVLLQDIHRITVLRGLVASPSAGAVTIDFDGQTQTYCGWSISEFSGINLGGTNGSGAVGNTASNTDENAGTSLTVTLPAFGSADNATYGVMRHSSEANTITAGTGFTELAETNNTNLGSFESEFKASNDTSVDWSFASSAGMLGIAVEIKAPIVGGIIGDFMTPQTKFWGA